MKKVTNESLGAVHTHTHTGYLKNIKIKNTGITIVSLVITIILLLILAGVSIRTLGGENGLITKTKIAKEENKKAEYKEKLSIAKTEAIVKKDGKNITLDEYIVQIKADKIDGIKSIEKITNEKASVITKEGYIFIITVNTIEYYENENTLPEMNIKDANIEFTFNTNTWTNGNVEVTVGKKESKYTLQLSKDTEKWITTTTMTFEENGEIYARLIDEIGRTSDIASRKITKIDKDKPVVTSVTSSTNSLRIKATDDAAGITGYAVTTSTTTPTAFTGCTSTKSLDVTVENLTQGTTYYAWIKDAAGNVSASKSTGTGTVTGLTISTNTANWSTSKTITITASNSNYSNIRYTTDGTIPTSTTGTVYTKAFTITSNFTITAVAFDSTGQAGSTATNKVATIDRTVPNNATITFSKTTANTTDNVSVTVAESDSESDVDLSKSKWVFNTSNEVLGLDASKYTGGTFTSKSQTLTYKNANPTTYYLHVLTVDKAGNAKETISGALKIKEARIKVCIVEDMLAENKGASSILNELPEIFTTVKYDRNLTVDQLKSLNYDVYIGYSWVWGLQKTSFYNELYAAGKNIITYGNDNETSLSIVKEVTGYKPGYTAQRIVTNKVTNAIGSTVTEGIDEKYIATFVSGTQVWYSFTNESKTYDIMGCLTGSAGNRWIHSQTFKIPFEGLKQAIYFAAGK